MSDRDQRLLSKFGADGTPSSAGPRAGGLPPVLLRLAATRVQIVAWVVLAGNLLGWVLANVAEGEFLQEGPRVEAITPAGAILSYQSRRFRLSAR